MDRVEIIEQFHGSEEQAITQFINDYLSGGGPDPQPYADTLFGAAYKLDLGEVRVLAVKRVADTLRERMLRASADAGGSIVVVRLTDNPRYDDRTTVDIVVRTGNRIDMLCDRTLFVSPEGQIAFVSSHPGSRGVIWVNHQLHVVDLPFEQDERSDGICRAARLVLLALRSYQ